MITGPAGDRLPRAGRAGTFLPLLGLILALPACEVDPPPTTDRQELAELRAELVERFTPGLHTMMVDLGIRHASLWFAGDAENWALVDYIVHEMEELVEDMEELHPIYREVPVAELLGEMTHPAIEDLEDAAEAGDREAFIEAYDRLTAACNACHTASDREALVIQRPTAPPLTNLRFRP